MILYELLLAQTSGEFLLKILILNYQLILFVSNSIQQ